MKKPETKQKRLGRPKSKKPAKVRSVAVMLKLHPEEAEALDAVRGDIPRAAYVRTVVTNVASLIQRQIAECEALLLYYRELEEEAITEGNAQGAFILRLMGEVVAKREEITRHYGEQGIFTFSGSRSQLQQSRLDRITVLADYRDKLVRVGIIDDDVDTALMRLMKEEGPDEDLDLGRSK